MKVLSTITAACLVVFFIGLLIVRGCVPDYSTGSRTGVVTKLSHKGMFVKTWEGEMNLGGMSKNSDGKLQPTVWSFTVENQDLILKLQDAAKNQKAVTIDYSQWLFAPSFRTDSGYLVLDVR